MSARIQPRHLTLDDLLSGRLFRIPKYQRAYSWRDRHRQDLFQDIRSVRDKDAEFHFMATIVGLRIATKTILTDEFDVVEVVDGQQRLTTLVLLYRAISRRLDADDSDESTVRDEIEALLTKNDDISPLLLQTNHDYSGYYTDYIREGKLPQQEEGETLAEEAIISAIRDCEEFAEEWPDLLELFRILKNRLTFILHELDDESAVYTVFEVLNSRGLPVPWIDRLKSILMEVAFEAETGNEDEHIDELHEVWGNIYRTIGIERGVGGESLRFAATLRARKKQSKVLSQEDAVQEIRVCVGEDVGAAIAFSRWILKVAEAVKRLRADPRKSAVTKIRHARFVSIAIELGSFEGQERRRLLEQWERSTYRIFGLSRKDARTGVGDYVRLGYRIEKGDPEVSEIESELRQLARGEFGVKRAVEHLRDENCYEGWKDELRYLLYRWEEHLAAQAGESISIETWQKIWSEKASKSIEHILPASKGSDEPTEEGIYVHRLGNLTLLPPGVNSQLQDKPPSAKGDTYGQQSLYVTTKLADDVANWDRDAVIAREEEIIAWAKSEWDDPKPRT